MQGGMLLLYSKEDRQMHIQVKWWENASMGHQAWPSL